MHYHMNSLVNDWGHGEVRFYKNSTIDPFIHYQYTYMSSKKICCYWNFCDVIMSNMFKLFFLSFPQRWKGPVLYIIFKHVQTFFIFSTGHQGALHVLLLYNQEKSQKKKKKKKKKQNYHQSQKNIIDGNNNKKITETHHWDLHKKDLIHWTKYTLIIIFKAMFPKWVK